MTTQIKIKDQSTGRNISNEIFVKFPVQMVSVKDIIEAKVTAEVEARHQQLSGIYNGFVEPADTEKILNEHQSPPQLEVNASKQVNAALMAFSQNNFFMLIDNIQASSPDQMVVINDKTEVTFLKLTPLVGG